MGMVLRELLIGWNTLLFEVSCRPITIADSSDVLHWRNDPASRQMSLTGNIILPLEHSRWFGSMLQSNTHIGIIGEKNRSKIGVVFFKIDNAIARVSINLNPLHRGKKLAASLLGSAMNEILIISPKIKHFVAEIKNNNNASIKIFTQNGFALDTVKADFGIYRTDDKRPGVTIDV